MTKISTLTATVLLMTGVAFAGEHTLQSSSEVKERSSHSTMADPSAQSTPDANNSATMETHKSTSQTTRVDPSGEVKVEKKYSAATAAENHSADAGTASQDTTHSERQSQQRTTEITPR